MRILPRLMIIIGLVLLTLMLLGEVRKYQARNLDDQTPVMVMFAAILLLAATAGTLFAKSVLPLIGEKVGAMIYGSNEVDESDPVIQAHEHIEEGDYEAAMHCLRQALAAQPDDTGVMGEIVDLQCRHLGEYEAAATFLEHYLERHWPPDELAFLRCKLAEIQGWYLGNPLKAREILLQIIEEGAGTLYAHTAENILLHLENGESAPS